MNLKSLLKQSEALMEEQEKALEQVCGGLHKNISHALLVHLRGQVYKFYEPRQVKLDTQLAAIMAYKSQEGSAACIGHQWHEYDNGWYCERCHSARQSKC